MQLQIDVNDLPIRSPLIAWEEFIQITDSTPERVRELVDMGWLTPTRTAEAVFIFKHDDAYRLRKLERLCADFDLHTLGGSIIVDLLERIERLEHRLRELRTESP
jgi:chaperone modulatory protein CbpM